MLPRQPGRHKPGCYTGRASDMKHLAIVTAVIAVFLFFALPNINPGPFTYDEADYMYAAGQGWLANYLDSPSLSFPDYVRMGLSRGRIQARAPRYRAAVRRCGRYVPLPACTWPDVLLLAVRLSRLEPERAFHPKFLARISVDSPDWRSIWAASGSCPHRRAIRGPTRLRFVFARVHSSSARQR